MKTIDVRCPACDQRAKIDPDHLGLTMQCGNCQREVSYVLPPRLGPRIPWGIVIAGVLIIGGVIFRSVAGGNPSEGAHNAAVLVAMVLGVALYFLPTFVAWSHKHRNVQALATLNLFLGWTVIGWVVSLVWAMYKRPGE
jgi:uncharacterized protein (DUF983 family)